LLKQAARRLASPSARNDAKRNNILLIAKRRRITSLRGRRTKLIDFSRLR